MVSISQKNEALLDNYYLLSESSVEVQLQNIHIKHINDHLYIHNTYYGQVHQVQI
jgi:hypothetical protein